MLPAVLPEALACAEGNCGPEGIPLANSLVGEGFFFQKAQLEPGVLQPVELTAARPKTVAARTTFRALVTRIAHAPL